MRVLSREFGGIACKRSFHDTDGRTKKKKKQKKIERAAEGSLVTGEPKMGKWDCASAEATTQGLQPSQFASVRNLVLKNAFLVPDL